MLQNPQHLRLHERQASEHLVNKDAILHNYDRKDQHTTHWMNFYNVTQMRPNMEEFPQQGRKVWITLWLMFKIMTEYLDFLQPFSYSIVTSLWISLLHWEQSLKKIILGRFNATDNYTSSTMPWNCLKFCWSPHQPIFIQYSDLKNQFSKYRVNTGSWSSPRGPASVTDSCTDQHLIGKLKSLIGFWGKRHFSHFPKHQLAQDKR